MIKYMSAVKDLEVLKKCRETIKLALVTFTGNIIDYVTLRVGGFGIDGLVAGPYRMSVDSPYRDSLRSLYHDVGECLTFSKTDDFRTNVRITFSNAKPTDGMNGVLAEIKIMHLNNYHDPKTYCCRLYHVPLSTQDEGAFKNLYDHRLFWQDHMVEELEATLHTSIDKIPILSSNRFPSYN